MFPHHAHGDLAILREVYSDLGVFELADGYLLINFVVFYEQDADSARPRRVEGSRGYEITADFTVGAKNRKRRVEQRRGRNRLNKDVLDACLLCFF